jgi:hypothetical protein
VVDSSADEIIDVLSDAPDLVLRGRQKSLS